MKNSWLIYSAIGLLFVFLYYNLNSKKVSTNEFASKNSTAGQKNIYKGSEKIVNRHLGMTSKKIEIEEELQRLDSLSAPNLQPGESIFKERNSTYPIEKRNYSIDDTPDRSEMLAIEDIELNRKELKTYSPGDVIQSELYRKENKDADYRVYKEQYAKKFIENAKKAGWNVILDEDYKIKSIAPLPRHPNSP